MKPAAMMAIGVSLFVFGILWLFFTSSLVYALIPSTGRNMTEMSQADLVRQIAGVVVATVGAGLFTYGRAIRTGGPQPTIAG